SRTPATKSSSDPPDFPTIAGLRFSFSFPSSLFFSRKSSAPLSQISQRTQMRNRSESALSGSSATGPIGRRGFGQSIPIRQIREGLQQAYRRPAGAPLQPPPEPAHHTQVGALFFPG